ncbi:MAG: NitT/TauT family transport system ATP-binding protein [Verrucomicrobiota bacterium]|jgi:ABC-type nitrate/sulfonate/bicarbonate transport system ATPase subunit
MLDLASVSFKWWDSSRTPVFTDISINVADGERVAITGMSGIGKTTLCRLMCALLKPTAGRVTLDDIPFEGPSSAVTMVFQQYTCFEWLTVIGNVRFGSKNPINGTRITETEAETLLERVGLSEVALTYPADLSGGMRQRVAIARALAVRPRVLILDEPFSALDLITKRRLGEMVMELQDDIKCAVVVTLHNIEDIAAFATRAICLRGRPARISAEITPNEVSFEDLRAQIETAITPKSDLVNPDMHR